MNEQINKPQFRNQPSKQMVCTLQNRQDKNTTEVSETAPGHVTTARNGRPWMILPFEQ